MDRDTQAVDPMQMVIDRLKDIRRKRNLTAQQLAEAMTKAGVRWEYGVVTKLETGRRKALSVTELLALAYVLDVSPLSLLTPEDDAEMVQATPTMTLTGEALGRWIAGQRPKYVGDPPFDPLDADTFDWAAQLPRWRRAEILLERRKENAEVMKSWQRTSPEIVAIHAEISRRIEAGELPPDVLETWKSAMTTAGLRLTSPTGEHVDIPIPQPESEQ